MNTYGRKERKPNYLKAWLMCSHKWVPHLFFVLENKTIDLYSPIAKVYTFDMNTIYLLRWKLLVLIDNSKGCVHISGRSRPNIYDKSGITFRNSWFEIQFPVIMTTEDIRLSIICYNGCTDVWERQNSISGSSLKTTKMHKLKTSTDLRNKFILQIEWFALN